MTDLLAIADWPDRVEALVARIGAPLVTCRVLAECDSTQDVARSLGVGGVVVTGRQVAGRGQRGNHWCDTGDDGLAFSLALPATDDPQRSLAIATALVASLDVLHPGGFAVKPPNDVLLEGRKVAGVLVEQSDGVAVIGVGINVRQASFPDDLDGVAISLAQVGVEVERIDILERVLPGIVTAWAPS
ncbi:MAG: biotin--[acetyl-CoA-carboxylase] ligase [Phycisphaerales bacterium]|nr:biotin--[acetyl-CoA-carboxylase] ligase [Phycisphaerales bacterium]